MTLSHRFHKTTPGDNDNSGWKPSVYWVTGSLFVSSVVFSSCASVVFQSEEGWSFVDSFYYCFAAFTSVGFGDYVSGDLDNYPYETVYTAS